MGSVEEVGACLDEFMRRQEIANSTFAPDRENQDVVNTELGNRVGALETGLQQLVERRFRVTELQERIVNTETMSVDRSWSCPSTSWSSRR